MTGFESRALTPEQSALLSALPPSFVTERTDYHVHRTPRFGRFRTDFLSAGNEALAKAALSFSPKFGTSFSTWARSHVDWAILTTLRREARHEGLREAGAVALRMGVLTGPPTADDKLDPSTDDEVAAKTKLQGSLRTRSTAAILALSAEVCRLEQAEVDPADVAALRPLVAATRTLRAELPPREQEILRLVYDCDLLLSEVAAALGLAYPTVKVLHAKLLKKLRAQLEALGQTFVLGG